MISANFSMPENASDSIIIEPDHYPLRMSMSPRSCIGHLDTSWNGRGMYLLFGHNASHGFDVYVGKAPTSLQPRVKQQFTRTDNWEWERALLLYNSTPRGWHSAEIGWLEGAFYDLYNRTRPEILKNKARPKDESVSTESQDQMKLLVLRPVLSVLNTFNLGPDSLKPANQLPLNSMSSKKEVTWFSEAYEILLNANAPMHYKDIMSEIIKRKALTFSGSTPERTLSRTLTTPIRELEALGEDPMNAVFQRVDNGTYQINAAYYKK